MSDISPIVRCVNADESIAFLTKAFGLDTDYGSRDYAAKDVDGNTSYFGTYRPAKP